MANWDDSWYDDEEFPPIRGRRSKGGAIAVAIITFIMSAVNALSSACLLFCGLLLSAFDRAGNGQFLPGDVMQNGIIMLAVGLASLAAFVTQIVVGIGLINLKSWARTLSFYLAGYSALICGLLGYLFWLGFDRGDEGQIVLWAFGLLAHGGYLTAVLAVLLNSRVAASFR